MNDLPRLDPPGAGVPPIERFVGRRILLPWWCLRMNWERAVERMELQGEQLLELGARLAKEEVTRRVLIPPQIGLEDSSRFCSVAMVVEHLTIVGERLGRIVVDLTHSRVPPGRVDTAELKAGGGKAWETAVGEYRSMLGRFRRAALHEVGDRKSRERFPHPWFGPLPAYPWLVFGPFHQEIHLRQAQSIAERLNDP
ncbi:MAG: DinB family protein [bacterium]|nr:DinB family protein [bacterium]